MSDEWEELRDQIIGLGERSFQKSYYPQLQHNLNRLERFRALLDHVADFVMLLSLPSGEIEDVNSAFSELTGIPTEHLIGTHFETLDIADAASIMQTLRHDMSPNQRPFEPKPHTTTVQIARKDKTVWLELSFSLAAVDPCCHGVVIGRDVTLRRQNELTLNKLLAEQQALLDNALVGIAMLRERTIISCNRRLEEIFGYRSGELLDCSTRILFPTEQSFRATGQQAYLSLEQNAQFSATLEMLKADGSLF
jgi:PAS domain S-box-containing protein